MFIQQEGKVIMMNASLDALLKAQQLFADVADEMGLKDDEDVVDMMKEILAERGSGYKCV